MWYPYYWSTYPSSLNLGTTTPDCQSRVTVTIFHATLKRQVHYDSPTMSRGFSISQRISSTPSTLPLRSFFTTSETSAKDTLHTLPPPQGTCQWGSGVFKKFLPPPSDIPSQSQQVFSPAKHALDQALFSPPESLDGRHQQWMRVQPLCRSLVPEPVLCTDGGPATSLAPSTTVRWHFMSLDAVYKGRGQHTYNHHPTTQLYIILNMFDAWEIILFLIHL